MTGREGNPTGAWTGQPAKKGLDLQQRAKKDSALSFLVRSSFFAACGVLLAVMLGLSGCRSYHIETTVENRTGAAIQLLEVDYPSASFGADSLATGAPFHYRIQIRGEGPVRVQYTGVGGRQEKIDGPTLYERQEGSLQIVLMPGGKAEFYPQLRPER